MLKEEEQPLVWSEEALYHALQFQSERYDAGRLIELDAPEGAVIHVRKGRVLVTTVDQTGHETICVLRNAGSFIGLESLGGMVLPYYLWTLGDVELAIASSSSARSWLRSGTPQTQSLISVILGALKTSMTEQVSLHGSVMTRLTRLLLNASKGSKDDRATAGEMLTLPKNVLARMLHMRAETLSRTLRKLEDAGGITLDPKLRVKNLQVLEEILEKRNVD